MECKRVTQRIKEVEVFLNTQKTDTLLVSATHCAERNYVNIPNYITYATNLPDGRDHAGSAIIKRQDIKHHDIAKYETDHTKAWKTGMDVLPFQPPPPATQLKMNNKIPSSTHYHEPS
jgi:hypothetical protein